MKWYVYILGCSNGSLYVGHTHDLAARLHRHQDGTGAGHTAVHVPTAVLYHECFPTELEAIQREQQLKHWSRAKKQALIAGDKVLLHQLSKSHDHAE